MINPVYLHLLKAVWSARVTWFWPIWLVITFAAAFATVRVVGRAAVRMINGKEKNATDLTLTRRFVCSRGAIVALALLALFLVCRILLTLMWEDFAYYDNDYFTVETLKGHDIRPPIYGHLGRFFPLGHQEFDLIRHFTASVAGYHALPMVELVLLSCALLALDELSITARAGLTALALITPAIVISFGGLIFSERNVVLSLACLVLSVKRFEQTQYIAWAVAAVVCAQIMLYYKETAFVLLLCFALGRLILRCRNGESGRCDYNRLRERNSVLDVCLASLAVLFLLYYAAAMLPHPNMQYAHRARLPRAEVFLAYMKMDLLAWLLVAVVLGRSYLILRRRAVPSPLWDGLAFGGVGCLAVYLYLGMFSVYYLAPVDLIAVLYVGRFAILSMAKMHFWSRAVSLILLFVIVLQDVSLSALSLFERKNLIHAKTEVARLVDRRYSSRTGNPVRLFFPFASPYAVMEFASYLNYRGSLVEGIGIDPAGPTDVVLVSRAVANDGPCVDYRSFVCHAGHLPHAGDLVIVLPDDDASLSEVAPYRERGGLLFSYEPRPRIAPWLYPLAHRLPEASLALHTVSPVFPHKDLPDRWLDASVTVWK